MSIFSFFSFLFFISSAQSYTGTYTDEVCEFICSQKSCTKDMWCDCGSCHQKSFCQMMCDEVQCFRGLECQCGMCRASGSIFQLQKPNLQKPGTSTPKPNEDSLEPPKWSKIPTLVNGTQPTETLLPTPGSEENSSPGINETSPQEETSSLEDDIGIDDHNESENQLKGDDLEGTEFSKMLQKTLLSEENSENRIWDYLWDPYCESLCILRAKHSPCPENFNCKCGSCEEKTFCEKLCLYTHCNQDNQQCDCGRCVNLEDVQQDTNTAAPSSEKSYEWSKSKKYSNYWLHAVQCEPGCGVCIRGICMDNDQYLKSTKQCESISCGEDEICNYGVCQKLDSSLCDSVVCNSNEMCIYGKCFPTYHNDGLDEISVFQNELHLLSKRGASSSHSVSDSSENESWQNSASYEEPSFVTDSPTVLPTLQPISTELEESNLQLSRPPNTGTTFTILAVCVTLVFFSCGFWTYRSFSRLGYKKLQREDNESSQLSGKLNLKRYDQNGERLTEFKEEIGKGGPAYSGKFWISNGQTEPNKVRNVLESPSNVESTHARGLDEHLMTSKVY